LREWDQSGFARKIREGKLRGNAERRLRVVAEREGAALLYDGLDDWCLTLFWCSPTDFDLYRGRIRRRRFAGELPWWGMRCAFRLSCEIQDANLPFVHVTFGGQTLRS